jgi:hypothetical protein
MVAEPSNLSSALLLGKSRFEAPLDEILATTKLQLLCERGKQTLGLGHNSIGELVPGMFDRLGLTDIQVFQSDQTNALFGARHTPAMKAKVKSGSISQRGIFGFGVQNPALPVQTSEAVRRSQNAVARRPSAMHWLVASSAPNSSGFGSSRARARNVRSEPSSKASRSKWATGPFFWSRAANPLANLILRRHGKRDGCFGR